jgi:excisionase family DNA binding protein
MLTVREVARRLGLSRASVYTLCARGDLGHVRLLNVLRIPARALEALSDAGVVRRG